jgi:prefoldin subunit 5
MRIQSLEAILQNKEESIGNLRAYIQRLERQLTALAERLNEAEKALDDLANSWTATVIKTAVLSGSAGIIIGVIIGIIVE